jgi:hypothetical protein
MVLEEFYERVENRIGLFPKHLRGCPSGGGSTKLNGTDPSSGGLK